MNTLYESRMGEQKTKEEWVAYMSSLVGSIILESDKSLGFKIPDNEGLWKKAQKIFKLEEVGVHYLDYPEADVNLAKCVGGDLWKNL